MRGVLRLIVVIVIIDGEEALVIVTRSGEAIDFMVFLIIRRNTIQSGSAKTVVLWKQYKGVSVCFGLRLVLLLL